MSRRGSSTRGQSPAPLVRIPRSTPCNAPDIGSEGRAAPRQALADRRPRSGERACSRLDSGGVGLRHWQHHSKLGPARSRFDGNFAVIVANEAPNNVETQAGALAHWLGGHERIEDTPADLLGDAAAVVDDAHHHTLMLALRR